MLQAAFPTHEYNAWAVDVIQHVLRHMLLFRALMRLATAVALFKVPAYTLACCAKRRVCAHCVELALATAACPDKRHAALYTTYP
jgi:hypothetical protein